MIWFFTEPEGGGPSSGVTSFTRRYTAPPLRHRCLHSSGRLSPLAFLVKATVRGYSTTCYAPLRYRFKTPLELANAGDRNP